MEFELRSPRKASIKSKLCLVGVLGIATVLCMAASGGCGSVLHGESDAAAGIAATLKTAAETNHNDTFETPEEKTSIANYIDAVARANDNFIAAIQAAEASGGKVNTPAIQGTFKALVDSVNVLNADGVLHLKSPQARADLQIAVSALQGALNGMQALASQQTSRNTPPLRKGIPVLAVLFTAEELEELIALAIAAGSELVPKLIGMRGKTDAELLAQAQADDAAAEQIAEGDGAPAPGATNSATQP